MARHRAGSENAERARGTSVMRTHAIDTVDLRILHILLTNGRATNVEIAAFANVTAPPTLRRTRTLEDQGIIRGYHAVLDGRKLGFEVMAFIQVRLASQSSDHVRRFEDMMSRLPDVRECHALSGHRDFLLKCIFRDLAASRHFVTDTLLKTDNVASVTTAFCIHVTKDAPGVPLALADVAAPLPARRKLKLPPPPRS